MINSNEIEKIFIDCLFKDNEIKNGNPVIEPVVLEGITMNVGFNPNRLEKHRNEIELIIDNLHPTFYEGWTFLNMCFDKNNNQWTGSHRTMEQMMLLGLAVGKLEYCCDKAIWFMLPGNMPYIKIVL